MSMFHSPKKIEAAASVAANTEALSRLVTVLAQAYARELQKKESM
ncbi:hypothetical protein OE699_09345 [Sedimentimonas flavescens]|uniref:Uncharacterized protein n=1 Tax=Sedimentimonas flavescens TaxID=2851012 RepID=A0ABT2ZZ78_9RHOB|nr:hypothetical protein [Sedimentimonas flavescens]MCV2879059.1 hypothetical protein [Sedimentimonas flavescens]